MTAIVAYVLGEHWTEPEIRWMSVSSDGYVTTDSDFIGDASDFDRNVRKLLLAIGGVEGADHLAALPAAVRGRIGPIPDVSARQDVPPPGAADSAGLDIERHRGYAGLPISSWPTSLATRR